LQSADARIRLTLTHKSKDHSGRTQVTTITSNTQAHNDGA